MNGDDTSGFVLPSDFQVWPPFLRSRVAGRLGLDKGELDLMMHVDDVLVQDSGGECPAAPPPAPADNFWEGSVTMLAPGLFSLLCTMFQLWWVTAEGYTSLEYDSVELASMRTTS